MGVIRKVAKKSLAKKSNYTSGGGGGGPLAGGNTKAIKTPVSESNLSVNADGELLNSNTQTIDFTGNAVSTTTLGTEVTVTIEDPDNIEYSAGDGITIDSDDEISVTNPFTDADETRLDDPNITLLIDAVNPVFTDTNTDTTYTGGAGIDIDASNEITTDSTIATQTDVADFFNTHGVELRTYSTQVLSGTVTFSTPANATEVEVGTAIGSHGVRILDFGDQTVDVRDGTYYRITTGQTLGYYALYQLVNNGGVIDSFNQGYFIFLDGTDVLSSVVAGTAIVIDSDEQTHPFLYHPFTGATDSADGLGGLVPAPSAGDEDKVLKGDGTWADDAGGAESLDDLTDAVITTPADGQALTYNGTNWINEAIPLATATKVLSATKTHSFPLAELRSDANDNMLVLDDQIVLDQNYLDPNFADAIARFQVSSSNNSLNVVVAGDISSEDFILAQLFPAHEVTFIGDGFTMTLNPDSTFTRTGPSFGETDTIFSYPTTEFTIVGTPDFVIYDFTGTLALRKAGDIQVTLKDDQILPTIASMETNVGNVLTAGMGITLDGTEITANTIIYDHYTNIFPGATNFTYRSGATIVANEFRFSANELIIRYATGDAPTTDILDALIISALVRVTEAGNSGFDPQSGIYQITASVTHTASETLLTIPVTHISVPGSGDILDNLNNGDTGIKFEVRLTEGGIGEYDGTHPGIVPQPTATEKALSGAFFDIDGNWTVPSVGGSLADGSVDEVKLNIDTVGTDGQVLTRTADGMDWEDASSGVNYYKGVANGPFPGQVNKNYDNDSLPLPYSFSSDTLPATENAITIVSAVNTHTLYVRKTSLSDVGFGSSTNLIHVRVATADCVYQCISINQTTDYLEMVLDKATINDFTDVLVSNISVGTGMNVTWSSTIASHDAAIYNHYTNIFPGATNFTYRAGASIMDNEFRVDSNNNLIVNYTSADAPTNDILSALIIGVLIRITFPGDNEFDPEVGIYEVDGSLIPNEGSVLTIPVTHIAIPGSDEVLENAVDGESGYKFEVVLSEGGVGEYDGTHTGLVPQPTAAEKTVVGAFLDIEGNWSSALEADLFIKNNAFTATLGYTSGRLTSILYEDNDSSLVLGSYYKTLFYNASTGRLSSIRLFSGTSAVDDNLIYTKVLVYTDGILTSITPTLA